MLVMAAVSDPPVDSYFWSVAIFAVAPSLSFLSSALTFSYSALFSYAIF
jgi:hypothetical protein